MARRPSVIGPPSTHKLLGALPVVAGFARRLDIAGIIDRACPIRELATLSHGQVIEVLIANRLTSPRPLVHVADWAAAWAVSEVFGPDPDTLNDDRIGRALDALAPVLEQVVGSVGLSAIAAFGLDVSRLHWDMTSISLFGAYPGADDDFATPRFGHPKDRRTDLKQIQAGLAVTGDGEVSQVAGAMESLRTLAGERRLLMVGDSKLVSYPNLAAMINAGVDFIAPASKTYVPAATLARCELAAATAVEYLAGRDSAKKPEDRGSYRVSEDTMTLAGRHSGPGRCGCAGSSCTPPPGPVPPRPPGPRSSTGPATTCTASAAAWAAGTTPPRPPSPTGSPRSPAAAASVPTCAPRSARTTTANRPWPGSSTKPRSRPKPPPTAGTPCSPTSTPNTRTPPKSCAATKAKKPSNGATARSKAPSPSRRCSCTPTAESTPSSA